MVLIFLVHCTDRARPKRYKSSLVKYNLVSTFLAGRPLDLFMGQGEFRDPEALQVTFVLGISEILRKGNQSFHFTTRDLFHERTPVISTQ